MKLVDILQVWVDSEIDRWIVCIYSKIEYRFRDRYID